MSGLSGAPSPEDCAQAESLTREAYALIETSCVSRDRFADLERRIASHVAKCLGADDEDFGYTIEQFETEFLAAIHTGDGRFFATISSSPQRAFLMAASQAVAAVAPND